MPSYIRLTRLCEYCGKEFEARTTVTRTCGKAYAKLAYRARQKAGKVDAYGLSDKTLYDLIRRHTIPKHYKGKYAYVPKHRIDALLSEANGYENSVASPEQHKQANDLLIERENLINKMSYEEVNEWFMEFTKLLNKEQQPFLAESQVIEFIERAFYSKPFDIKQTINGPSGKVIDVFYRYYSRCGGLYQV